MSDLANDLEGKRRAIARLLDGVLSEEESKELADQLKNDDELRLAYARQARLNAMLAWSHGSVGTKDYGEIDPLAMAEMLEEMQRSLLEQEAEEALRRAAEEARIAEERRLRERQLRSSARRPEPIVIPYSVVYLCAAGLAASLLWAVFTFRPSGDSVQELVVESEMRAAAPANPSHATLTDSTRAELTTIPIDSSTDGSVPFATVAGTRLDAGNYELVEGVIRLNFDSGATVIIEAPASFALGSTERLRITHGRLVGNVPPQAIGFTIDSPTASIIDLGTEFGVDAQEGNAAEIIVFDGEVEVVAATTSSGGAEQSKGAVNASTRRRLTADSSVRVDDLGVFSRAEWANRNLFYRAIPGRSDIEQKQAYERLIQENSFAHWVFPSGEVRDQISGQIGELNGEAIVTEGVLSLNGGESRAVMRDPPSGPSLNHAYTISLWVRSDQIRKQNVLVRTNDDGPTVHFSHQLLLDDEGHFVHYAYSKRPAGSAGSSWIVGTTAAQSGRWYHVAIAASSGSPTRLYVNGVQEVQSRSSIREQWDLGNQIHIGNTANNRWHFGEAAAIVGAVTDVQVYDIELRPEMIAWLYRISKKDREKLNISG